ncbi:hypothetical protein Pmani_038588 [Petrolisthes manimaculis]|uniref:Uncharacterized protein n=1 Tax=Petrolisthes manimaculis TaxID=1843537 RepID=A0AAE1TKD4_9EUCA|nr:hypothetical protein Pmani_038588 [Petrolisthes manimaculis]
MTGRRREKGGDDMEERGEKGGDDMEERREKGGDDREGKKERKRGETRVGLYTTSNSIKVDVCERQHSFAPSPRITFYYLELARWWDRPLAQINNEDALYT